MPAGAITSADLTPGDGERLLGGPGGGAKPGTGGGAVKDAAADTVGVEAFITELPPNPAGCDFAGIIDERMPGGNSE